MVQYQPKYVQTDEVPVEVPDDYSTQEKVDALEFAESALELDINDGDTIPQGDVTTQMIVAVKQKATCEMVKGAEEPTSVKLGDLTDDGTTKVDYAESFCDRYDELVDKLNEAGVLGEDSGQATDPYVYNTSDPTPGNNPY